MSEVPYLMTIDGKRVAGADLGTAINPANEAAICQFPMASRQQLESAVAAAKRAFPAWRDTSMAERQTCVSKLGDLIEKNQEEFVRLLITEAGKARAGAEWEVGGSIHWMHEIAKQSLPEEVIEQNGTDQVVTRHTPIGVIGGITPWNFPLLLATWKIAPALVAGNTMVLKPSPYTPLATLWFGELAQAVLPPGVLNIVSGGNDLGQWIAEHADIGKIAFTGSTATGRKVMQSASSNLKRLTLELGGNDPAIVLPDADVKTIAKEIFWGSFVHSSQFCVATKRLYVHEDLYDALAAELVSIAESTKMGDGMDEGVELGPLQNKMQFDKVSGLLRDCQQNNMKFLTGGSISAKAGYFVPVTLVDNPPDDSRCVVEEAFGPVLPLLKYSDVDDAIARANSTAYGLAASVWGHDVSKAEAVASRLEAGTVWINHIHQFGPNIAFGGHKQSGVGIENSLHGLAEYTNIQTVMRKAMA